ncbi:DUF7577 domain-containing protein [Natranaeroarchaeum aerophilus]|uniref:DUF7577 domain-containing protein n=1 Tax=Natranaeroarchaeum aerophilus TaxID=2917711 RepID=A0AAE3FQ47_9EURY|nr:hypothetical protein [Natranaeroarchaeum aerophilus]MCL9813045.1 hypothetical protein [Natranaeroarchaeum aerophilus]
MTPIESVPAWVFVYAGVFALFHLLIGYYLYRRSNEPGVRGTISSPQSPDRPLDADATGAAPERRSAAGPTVHCGHCNAENEPGYRYCRNCVQELPSVAEQSISTGKPDERESL